MIEMSENGVVYILAPNNYASGGPELLHQLGNILIKKGFNAKIAYYNLQGKVVSSPIVHERLTKYNVPVVTEIYDDAENVIIVPEQMLIPLTQFSKIRKCIWWLGANNYYWVKETYNKKRDFVKGIYHNGRKLLGFKSPPRLTEIKNDLDYNIAQCHYAISYLQHRKIKNVGYLSDYLSEEFISQLCNENNFKAQEKENIILYNPSRDISFIKKLMKKKSSLVFVPLKNLSQEELRRLYSKAKIYIDFGAHPGKDRIPREAASFGCCVITSNLGSAGYYEDMPIPSKYKFSRTDKNVDKVINLIMEIFDNYNTNIRDFETYRMYINNEREWFEKDIDMIFSTKTL